MVNVLGTALFIAIPQLSVDPLSISSAVIDALPSASRATEMSLHNAAGFSSSVTVTVWLQLAVLPFPSVTIQVTVVTPVPKV